MALLIKTAITPIISGDIVEPTVANEPHDDLETNIDTLIDYIKNTPSGWFEYDDVNSTGLTFNYDGGVYNNQNVPYDISAGTRSLGASVTSYVEIDSSTNTISHNTSSFSAANIPLWEVVTDGSSITGTTDRRSPFFLRTTRGVTDTATTVQVAITDTNVTFSNDIVYTNASISGAVTYAIRPAFDGGTSGSTSPFTVDSTQVVTNLNADLLDGLDQGDFIRSNLADTISGVLTFNAIPLFNGGTSGASSPFTVDSTQVVTNLNADLLDDIQGASYARSDAADTISAIHTHTARPAFNGGTSGSTSPFTVDSTQVVTNLNADRWDGGHKTVSTAAPTGGTDLDVWFEYTV